MPSSSTYAPPLNLNAVLQPVADIALVKGFSSVPTSLLRRQWQRATQTAYASLTQDAKEALKATIKLKRDATMAKTLLTCNHTTSVGLCRKCENFNAGLLTSVNFSLSRYPMLDLNSSRPAAGPHGSIEDLDDIPEPIFCTAQQFVSHCEDVFNGPDDVSDSDGGTDGSVSLDALSDDGEAAATASHMGKPQLEAVLGRAVHEEDLGGARLPAAIAVLEAEHCASSGGRKLAGDGLEVASLLVELAGRRATPPVSPSKAVVKTSALVHGTGGRRKSARSVRLAAESQSVAGMVPKLRVDKDRQTDIREWLPLRVADREGDRLDDAENAPDEPEVADAPGQPSAEDDAEVLMEGQAAPLMEQYEHHSSDSGDDTSSISGGSCSSDEENLEARNPRFVYLQPTDEQIYSGAEVLAWSEAAFDVVSAELDAVDAQAQAAKNAAAYAADAAQNVRRSVRGLRDSIDSMRGSGFMLEPRHRRS